MRTRKSTISIWFNYLSLLFYSKNYVILDFASRLSAVATVMVLANWDHHYDLDKEVRMLTIPKDYLLLLVFVGLVIGFSLAVIQTVSILNCSLWLFGFILVSLLVANTTDNNLAKRYSCGLFVQAS